MRAKKLLKLNIGCGSNKLEGYVNIDGEAKCNPDLVINIITQKLPYRAGSVDEVVMFHCIEHINKPLHTKILGEIWRVLKPGGTLILSYPEFLKAVENWKTNLKGQKDFWENVLYGRQLYPGDYHVCIMHTPDFVKKLESVGFKDAFHCPEHPEQYNTVVDCVKGAKPKCYEDLIREDQVKHKFKKVRVGK